MYIHKYRYIYCICIRNTNTHTTKIPASPTTPSYHIFSQDGYTKPVLLTKADGQDAIQLYDRLDSVSSSEIDLGVLCLLQTGSESAGLEGIWLQSFHQSYGGPLTHLIPLDTTAATPDFKYAPRPWYALGDEYTLEPSIVGAGSAYYGLTAFALEAATAADPFVKNNISIEPKTGVITLKLQEIPEKEITVAVIGTGIVNNVNTSFSFRVGCKDGHFYKEGMCVKCKTGSFNSMAIYKENPNLYFNQCVPCEGKRTTVAEGSTSSEQCLCEKGYYMVEKDDQRDCLPCPAGMQTINPKP